MKNWATNVYLAVAALAKQLLLWLDQGGNVLLCGLVAVVVALFTGTRQAVAYADETMSAHCWRSYDRGRIWGRMFMPVIDVLFLWQGEDEEVNERAGRRVVRHCERAFWKELMQREMPPAYREMKTKGQQ